MLSGVMALLEQVMALGPTLFSMTFFTFCDWDAAGKTGGLCASWLTSFTSH